MSLSPFTSNWEFRREPDGAYAPVELPHDAMLGEGRSPSSPAGSHSSFFLGGTYRYRTTWTAPEELQGKQVSLLFEAVYRRSTVLVNGQAVGGAIGGYTTYEVRIDEELDLGSSNLIEVLVDNSELPNTRWYSGSGIYRPVWLKLKNPVHLVPDGVRLRTLETADTTRAEVSIEVANPAAETLDVVVTLTKDDREVARASAADISTTASLELTVPSAQLWSAEHPHLYQLDVVITCGSEVRDHEVLDVGLRVLEVDGRQGLRVNGHPVLLRGANVHHDQGVLGAATFPAAELRRVRLLKQAGFNAIRSAHNPASRALLDACDQLGMYVMDELYDGWYDHKVEHDDAASFADCWQGDARAMVTKDRNHPSVIMYSIGNENTEPTTRYGIETARALADFVRGLDDTRPVTMGVNLISAALSWPTKRKGSPTELPTGKSAPKMDSTVVNAVANQFGRLMKVVPRLKRTDAATRDLFAHLDVAGYNYGAVRYETDARLHPLRVIVGTESMPGQLPENWALVEKLPNVIGDFMWAGWDYLGEAGIGTWVYGAGPRGFLKPYPYLVSGSGALDLLGDPGAPVLLAQATWGQLSAPALAVRPPDLAGQRVRRTAWRSTDAVPSWSWSGCEGRPAHVEVYSCDEEVELLLNGRSLGRRPVEQFLARFTAGYEPGELTAIGYIKGVESGRSSLRSAGRTRLHLTAESQQLVADGQDLAYVRVSLADEHGVVEMLDDDLVQLTVSPPASLAGFGSAAPATEEVFGDNAHTTYRGRALAVVRAGTAAGRIRVDATSRRHGSASVELQQSPGAASLDTRKANAQR